MPSEFSQVDVAGWEWDLQGIYATYMGYFQSNNIAWYEKSWSALFESFDAFLGFNWPAVVVTDARTGRGHIVARSSTLQTFLRMVKTRFGETMPNLLDSMVPILPFEHNQRLLRNISDFTTYKKVHATLAAASFAALKARVRNGNAIEISNLWRSRDKNFLAIDFETSEKSLVALEMGYAVIRSAHLDSAGAWPPMPEDNYRKGHYIVQELVDKVHNKLNPTFPWEYAWGTSQFVSKSKLSTVTQALISSLASPEHESIPNSLVLVTSNPRDLSERLKGIDIAIPSNVLVLDVLAYERQIRSSRVPSPTGQNGTNSKSQAPLASLSKLMKQLNIFTQAPLNNSGNDAFYTLLCFQYMTDSEGTKLPQPRPAQKDGFPMVAPPANQFHSADRGRERHSRHISNGTGSNLYIGSAYDEFGGQVGQRMSMASNGAAAFPFPGMHRMSGSPSKLPPNPITRNSFSSSNINIPLNGNSSRSLRKISVSKQNKSVSPVRRDGSKAPDDQEDFKPPLAPFAKEGRQPGARTRSFGAYEDQQYATRNEALHRSAHGGSSSSLQPPNSAPPIPRPGIRVTHHNEINYPMPSRRESGGGGRKSPVSVGGRSGRSFGGSLRIRPGNVSGRERNKEKQLELKEEKRPQSDLLPTSPSKDVKEVEEKAKGGFLATMKRLSMRP